MSNRIDELVATVAYFIDENEYLVTREWADATHAALDEIATIARGAEAMCKCLVAERDTLLEERVDLARKNLALTLQLAGSDMPPIETSVSTTTTPRGVMRGE